MNVQCIISVVFLLTVKPFFTGGINLVVVSSGKDNFSCLNGSTKCKTLDYVSKNLEKLVQPEHITISIIPHTNLAQKNLYFKNLLNLTLQSNYSLTLPVNLHFHNVSRLKISAQAMGSKRKTTSKPTRNHTVLVTIENCQDVIIQDTVFVRSRETALFFKDNKGKIVLVNLTFFHNKNWATDDQIESHSGGVEIDLSGSTKANYIISKCTFERNSAPKHYQSFTTTSRADSKWRGQGLGGGLSVYYNNGCENKQVVISDCTFRGNSALWGGGLHVMFQGNATRNTLQVLDSSFTRNSADKGGGGICIRYFKRLEPPCQSRGDYNHMNFSRLTFSENSAVFGGGVCILSTYNQCPSDALTKFFNSTWQNNGALYGSAAMLSPALFQLLDEGVLPAPEFTDSTVRWNYIKTVNDAPNYLFGIFMVTKCIVYFSGYSVFEHNFDSALYLDSGISAFSSGSIVSFSSNSGKRGGAVALHGYSSLLLNEDSQFVFDSNTASVFGGAIYQESGKNGRICFIRHEKELDLSPNIQINFTNNSADVLGQSIYSTSLYPCNFYHSSGLNNGDVSIHIFDFLGNIVFDNADDAISTNSKKLINGENITEYQVFPGGNLSLSLTPEDELGEIHENIYSYHITSKNKRISVDRSYTVRGIMYLSGKEGEKDELMVTQDGVRRLTILLNVSLLPCPPGFYYDRGSMKCKCSVDGSSQHIYYGISSCENFHANLQPGYWIGYIQSNTRLLPTDLFTAKCPLQFCQQNIPETKLSSNATELIDQICQPRRTGILCGRCLPGYSPSFHSKNNINCLENRLCSVGILFYILSELVPICLLFTIIVALNLSFTSGEINGFVLFSQILDLLLMKYENVDEQINWALTPSKIFYDFLNFDYFSVPPLSFCLWKSAKVIDIVAFKYVTVIFALLLVLFLVLIFNKVKWNQVAHLVDSKRRLSVINGITALLVLGYAQCAKTSFYILTPVRLRTQGGSPGEFVGLFGGLPFFQGWHLFYSIVAIICILIVVIIPPTVLLCYPSLLHLLALCHQSEHWLVNKLLSVFMIERLKPMIDSFQSCYRDKVRFFAGLYFIYRIAILATFCMAHSTAQFYVLSQILLTLFLGIHCVVQPYKRRVHNVIDSFLFLVLVLLNASTIFIDVYDIQYQNNNYYGGREMKDIFVAFQIILIYLPIIVLHYWLGKKVITWLKRVCYSKKTVSKQNFEEEDMEFTLEYRNIPLQTNL